MGLPTALEAELNEQSALAGRARASFELTHAQRPSTLYQPRLSIDGNMWCALFGVDLQDGVAGFGKSPELALQDFDKNWRLQWTPRTRGTCGECEFGRFTNGKREGCGCGWGVLCRNDNPRLRRVDATRGSR